MITALHSLENIFALPINCSEGGNLSSSGQHSYELLICCRWDRRTAHDEGIVCSVIVNDYCLYTARPSLFHLLPFSQDEQLVEILFMVSEAQKEPNSTKWWGKEKKATHYRYFHPEKWNIKRVHYTLNLQLFLNAHGHFPIFPALLLARRSGPWEKSLFYYLNPCMGAEPGESSHVC